MSDWTEDRIRQAEPGALSERIAEVRGDERIDKHHFTGWKWCAPGGGRPHRQPVPTPYATEWWAAGPLLEELHDTTYKFNTKYFKGEEKEVVAPFGLTRVVASAPWVCGPTVEGRVKSFAKAETAPLAIARAWLLTYEHGLLEDYQ